MMVMPDRVLLAPIDDRVLVRLVYLYLVQQLRLVHDQLQAVPDEDGHVFGGAGQVLEVRHVLVQVEMVQLFHDRLVHVLLQVGYVHHHAGLAVDRAAHRHLHYHFAKGFRCEEELIRLCCHF